MLKKKNVSGLVLIGAASAMPAGMSWVLLWWQLWMQVQAPAGMQDPWMFRPPVPGRVSSRFCLRTHPILQVARFHRGVDIAAPSGTPVRTARAGQVRLAGWSGGYGQVVVVDHGFGWSSLYAHLARLQVRPGMSVASGAVLGTVGSTGLATGPHLHFELWYGRKALNPLKFLASGRAVPTARNLRRWVSRYFQ